MHDVKESENSVFKSVNFSALLAVYFVDLLKIMKSVFNKVLYM